MRGPPTRRIGALAGHRQRGRPAREADGGGSRKQAVAADGMATRRKGADVLAQRTRRRRGRAAGTPAHPSTKKLQHALHQGLHVQPRRRRRLPATTRTRRRLQRPPRGAPSTSSSQHQVWAPAPAATSAPTPSGSASSRSPAPTPCRQPRLPRRAGHSLTERWREQVAELEGQVHRRLEPPILLEQIALMTFAMQRLRAREAARAGSRERRALRHDADDLLDGLGAGCAGVGATSSSPRPQPGPCAAAHAASRSPTNE